MRIGLIAPPFIPVPPTNYGGTELFIAHLAVGLKRLGHDVIVYANGTSTVPVERRSLYPDAEWPIKSEVHGSLKDINHSGWAVADAQADCDLLHLNNAPGLVYSRFVPVPFVYTIHHPHEEALSEFYRYYPNVTYVTISHFQRLRETMPRIATVHHGLNFSKYRLTTEKQPYLAFIGRIAPVVQGEQILEARRAVRQDIYLADKVNDYIYAIVAATRSHPFIQAGISTRGGINLAETARAWAYLEGRDFVVPEDVKTVAVPVCAHRLICRAEQEGLDKEEILRAILAGISVPLV